MHCIAATRGVPLTTAGHAVSVLRNPWSIAAISTKSPGAVRTAVHPRLSGVRLWLLNALSAGVTMRQPCWRSDEVGGHLGTPSGIVCMRRVARRVRRAGSRRGRGQRSRSRARSSILRLASRRDEAGPGARCPWPLRETGPGDSNNVRPRGNDSNRGRPRLELDLIGAADRIDRQLRPHDDCDLRCPLRWLLGRKLRSRADLRSAQYRADRAYQTAPIERGTDRSIICCAVLRRAGRSSTSISRGRSANSQPGVPSLARS